MLKHKITLAKSTRPEKKTVSQSQIDLQTTLINERDQAIETIKDDMAEIHSLMEAMSQHVDTQGRDLSDIEYHLANSAQSAQAASEELKQAHANHKNKKCVVM